MEKRDAEHVESVRLIVSPTVKFQKGYPSERVYRVMGRVVREGNLEFLKYFLTGQPHVLHPAAGPALRHQSLRASPERSLEHQLTEILWKHGFGTDEQIREAFAPRYVLKDSTVRPVLGRKPQERNLPGES